MRNNKIPPAAGGKFLGVFKAKTLKNDENRTEFEPNLRKQLNPAKEFLKFEN